MNTVAVWSLFEIQRDWIRLDATISAAIDERFQRKSLMIFGS